MNEGTRVLAIESGDITGLRSYGEGVLHSRVPDIEPLNTMGITNPYIELDQGGYVWGFECWWEAPEKMREHFGNPPETLVAPPMRVKPKED